MSKTIKELVQMRETALQKAEQITQLAETEKRELTDAEKAEFGAHMAEVEKCTRSITLATTRQGMGSYEVQNRQHEVAEQLRKVMRGELDHLDFAFDELRALTYGTNYGLGGLESVMPSTMHSMLQPLESGLILGQLGIQMSTGLKPGHKWPSHNALEATIEGKTDVTPESVLAFNEFESHPKRLGLKVTLSNQDIDDLSDIGIISIVVGEIYKAVTRKLNQWMFCTQRLSGATDGVFASGSVKKVTFAGAVPTYKELLQMKYEVKKKGITNDGTFAYVMSSAMAAELAATPRGNGQTEPILKEGKIDGSPVYETEFIELSNAGTYISETAPKFVGFGCFSYAHVGQYGLARLIKDELSKADQDLTIYNYNNRYAVDVVRPEAFVLGTATIA